MRGPELIVVVSYDYILGAQLVHFLAEFRAAGTLSINLLVLHWRASILKSVLVWAGNATFSATSAALGARVMSSLEPFEAFDRTWFSHDTKLSLVFGVAHYYRGP